MLRNQIVVAPLLLLFVIESAADAWNARGHKVIAEIAWRKLEPAKRDAIVAKLRSHPRFDEDFANRMASEIGNAGTDVENHWIFCHAATWPDIARGLPSAERDLYHKARWHYINLPVFLDDTQAQQFAGNLPANVDFERPPNLGEEMLNGVQAVKNSIDVVVDSTASDEDKALHYCWLLHVIPDLHQPLHAASLYTVALFPTNDKGGNQITVRRAGMSGNGQNLHSLWDGLLGRQAGFNDALGKANQLITDHPTEFNSPFVALPFDVWSTEVSQLALDEAYQALLNDVRTAEAGGNALGVIDLPQSYFQNAGDVAGRQAVIAGVRLAGVLSSIVDVEVIPRPVFAGGRTLGFPAAIARAPEVPGRRVATRALGRPDGNGALADRVQQLEAEVRALRAQLSSLAREQSVELPAFPRRTHTRAIEVDTGEQCTCGANE